MLYAKDGRQESLLIRGARVIDPGEGVDATLDVRVDEGTIAQLGTSLDPNGHRVVEGAGLVLAPAFVDPHVHLRVPGREDEETLVSGTRAAAAGGYCAILAMPNTDPVVDSAAVLGTLVQDARTEAEVPVGFFAAITKGTNGAELTEMAELAGQGAVGFTDDGHPVVAPGLMRRALQYGAVTGRPLALHCEEPTLSRGGHIHEGPVSAELGFGGYPAVAESVMVERDLSLAAYEEQPLHLLHLSARESVEALARAQAAGVKAGRSAGGAVADVDDLQCGVAVRSDDLGPVPHVDVRPCGELVDEVLRHALLEAVTPIENGHASGVGREEHRSLPG